MRSALFGLLFLASLALSGCTNPKTRFHQPPQKTILTAERVELPTVFLNGMPYVELKINGWGPYRFLVDTGAETMVISPRLAREADVLVTPQKIKSKGAGGFFEEQSVVTIDRLEAPRFTLRGIQASVLSLESTRQLNWDENQIGGIIGMATFNHVLLEIDYPHHKVSVAKLESATPALKSGHPFAGVRPYGKRPQVEFATPSAKHPRIVFTIDTGAEKGFEISDITDFPVVGGLSKRDNFHHGVGGSWRPVYGQLNGDIRLGQATWRNPEILSANSNRIGSDALAPWKLVIDPKRRLLWLVGDQAVTTTTWTGPVERDGRPAVYGFATLPEGGSFVVKEVDQGSRAERAGLKVGDRYTWDSGDSGMPVERAGSDPTRMRMHIVRGAEKLEVVLSLRDQMPVKTTTGAEATATPATVTRD